MGETSIIGNHVALSESFTPDRLLHRDEQIREMHRCLFPATKKRKPIHLWLHGPPGSGKTATARHVLATFNQKFHIESLLVNCWEKDSCFEILDDLILQLRILRAEEHRTSLKLEKLRKHLGNRPVFIILDEIDRMKPSERSTVLYSLDTITNAGVICTSDSQDALFELEERVRSRLNPYPVAFSRYTSADLIDILTRRAEFALNPGTWANQTLRRIADIAGGDARIAIRMLRNAAELSQDQGSGQISTESLKVKWDDSRRAERLHRLNELTEDHRLIHGIVNKEGQVLSGRLWQDYVQRCSQLKRKPIAPRTFSDYANTLVQKGLVTSERARVKGKVRLFKRGSKTATCETARCSRNHNKSSGSRAVFC